MGAFRGARAAGAQWVGPNGPGEERGCRAAGCWERRAPAAATAAAAVRPGQAAKRARGPRSPAQPCECPRRFREPWSEWGVTPPIPPIPSQRRPVGPGSVALAAALFHITPYPGPGPRGVVPPLPLGAEDAASPTKDVACGPTAPGAASFQPTASPRRPVPQGSGAGQA